MPLVAFECGYRNQFMGEDGNWVSDHDRYATCMKGKLDILKYCRKVVFFSYRSEERRVGKECS